jgi:hypothetical protein
MLLNQCVINFKSTEFEQTFIKNYLSDALKRGLGVVEAPTPRVEEKKQETPKNFDNSMTQNQEMFDPKARMMNR